MGCYSHTHVGGLTLSLNMFQFGWSGRGFLMGHRCVEKVQKGLILERVWHKWMLVPRLDSFGAWLSFSGHIRGPVWSNRAYPYIHVEEAHVACHATFLVPTTVYQPPHSSRDIIVAVSLLLGQWDDYVAFTARATNRRILPMWQTGWSPKIGRWFFYSECGSSTISSPF
jgi:hypothetical protein